MYIYVIEDYSGMKRKVTISNELSFESYPEFEIPEDVQWYLFKWGKFNFGLKQKDDNDKRFLVVYYPGSYRM